jgi:hypothetical protein
MAARGQRIDAAAQSLQHAGSGANAFIVAAVDDQAGAIGERAEAGVRCHLLLILGLRQAQQRDVAGRYRWPRRCCMRSADTPVPDRGIDPALGEQRWQIARLIGEQHPAAHIEVVEAAPDQLIGRAFRVVAPVAHG